MSINIPTFYVSQFSTNVATLVQQKGSRLAKTVSQGSYSGSQASPVDQVAAITANKVVARFAPMGRTDAVLDRRWVFPVDYEVPQMIDHFDKLRLIVDPQSIYATNAMYALGRAQDDEIISAFFGNAKTGVNGATNTSFLAANVVSVLQGAAAASGMSVAKLREGRRLLMANEVDMDNDEIWCAMKAKQIDNLLGEAQVISTDFNDKPVLVDGKLTRFLGINFVQTERMTSGTDDQAGTSDAIALYAKSGMHLGTWEGLNVKINERSDLSGIPIQVYCKGTFGATRLEEKKIVKIWCR